MQMMGIAETRLIVGMGIGRDTIKAKINSKIPLNVIKALFWVNTVARRFVNFCKKAERLIVFLTTLSSIFFETFFLKSQLGSQRGFLKAI